MRTSPACALHISPVNAASRSFSLWGDQSNSNESMRKIVFERASEAQNEAVSVSQNAGSSASQSLSDGLSSLSQSMSNAASSMSNTVSSLTKGSSGSVDAAASSNESIVDSIQERLTDANEAVSSTISSEGELIADSAQRATDELQTMGLGGWSPSGLLQQLLDTTQHLTGLPWWATIIAVTCLIRLSVAPLLVYVQGNSIRLSNIQPQMQAMISDLEYAKSTGNPQDMQMAAIKVRKLMADNNCSPFRSLLLPLVQMPIFLSFYFALEGMAKAKMPSLMTGGVAWFPDLTVADPYYVLPIASSAMTLLVLETGAETGTSAMNQTPQARMVKNVLRGVTVLAAWFISNFPAALLVYWTTTNTFSLCQLMALRTRFLKRLLKLPERIEHPPQPHIKQKSFMEGIRSGMNASNAHPSTNARQTAPSALYRKQAERRAESVSGSRGKALHALMDDSVSVKNRASADTSASDKQSRVAAARERRLRQRS